MVLGHGKIIWSPCLFTLVLSTVFSVILADSCTSASSSRSGTYYVMCLTSIIYRLESSQRSELTHLEAFAGQVEMVRVWLENRKKEYFFQH